ncbi:hypothetical protein [Limnohabitans sp.]
MHINSKRPIKVWVVFCVVTMVHLDPSTDHSTQPSRHQLPPSNPLKLLQCFSALGASGWTDQVTTGSLIVLS